jgi:hypothetical protein
MRSVCVFRKESREIFTSPLLYFLENLINSYVPNVSIKEIFKRSMNVKLKLPGVGKLMCVIVPAFLVSFSISFWLIPFLIQNKKYFLLKLERLLKCNIITNILLSKAAYKMYDFTFLSLLFYSKNS